MDDAMFRFLKNWASCVADEIIGIDDIDCSVQYEIWKKNNLKIKSIILESMSPSNGWKNGK
jgi:hypothetical protein